MNDTPESASSRLGRTGACLAILIACWLGAILLDETLPVNGGLGWDGSRFARMAQEGPRALVNGEINSYYVQRVGPSYAVRAMLLAARAEMSDENVRRGFIILNVTLLGIALFLLSDAAAGLGLGGAGQGLLLAGLFLNLPNARFPVYYAPIGDATAFFLGSLAAWGYVVRSRAAIIVAFLLAIVAWPAAFALAPLLLWPRPAIDGTSAEASRSSAATVSLAWLAALPAGAIVIGFLWWASRMPLLPADLPGLKLSLTLNALFIGGIVISIGAVFWTRRERIEWRLSATGAVVLVALVIAGVLYVRAFESGSAAFSGQTYVREILLFARSRPLTAPAGHVAYFGGLAVVAMALWPRVLRGSLGAGLGAFATVAIAGLMAADAESRRLNAGWPILGLFAAKALEPLCHRRLAYLASLVMLFATSKLWWPMNGPDLFTALHAPGNYTNTQGPNMSPDATAAHLALAAVLGIVLISLARRTESGADRRSDAPSP